MKSTPYDKLGLEPLHTTRMPPPVQVEPAAPDYYILDIGDLVGDFVKRWDSIINSEIMAHPADHEVAYPEVFTLAPDGTIQRQVYLHQHVSETTMWHPDISMIINAALEATKSRCGAKSDLDMTMGSIWIDVIHMADVQVRSNIPTQYVIEALSNTRRQIADLSVDFGKKLYQRMIEFGLYTDGHFPYHYVGWQNDCVLVAFDQPGYPGEDKLTYAVEDHNEPADNLASIPVLGHVGDFSIDDLPMEDKVIEKNNPE